MSHKIEEQHISSLEISNNWKQVFGWNFNNDFKRIYYEYAMDYYDTTNEVITMMVFKNNVNMPIRLNRHNVRPKLHRVLHHYYIFQPNKWHIGFCNNRIYDTIKDNTFDQCSRIMINFPEIAYAVNKHKIELSSKKILVFTNLQQSNMYISNNDITKQLMPLHCHHCNIVFIPMENKDMKCVIDIKTVLSNLISTCRIIKHNNQQDINITIYGFENGLDITTNILCLYLAAWYTEIRNINIVTLDNSINDIIEYVSTISVRDLYNYLNIKY